jgi:hypothetical protein
MSFKYFIILSIIISERIKSEVYLLEIFLFKIKNNQIHVNRLIYELEKKMQKY